MIDIALLCSRYNNLRRKKKKQQCKVGRGEGTYSNRVGGVLVERGGIEMSMTLI